MQATAVYAPPWNMPGIGLESALGAQSRFGSIDRHRDWHIGEPFADSKPVPRCPAQRIEPASMNLSSFTVI